MQGADLKPCIVLCEPQLGENIGAVARAMLNCGLTDLRIVNPRDGWPSESALAASAGADAVIEGARIFASTEAAIADLHLVFATTARLRDMVKPILSPSEAVTRIVAASQTGLQAGILFGRERSGLTNDQVTLADAALTFPLNPGFTSLNLAQAVLLVGWEWRKAVFEAAPPEIVPYDSRPATQHEIQYLFQHLEQELDKGGFFFPPEKRPHMERNLRNLLIRAGITEQDVRTLHGVVVCLTSRRHRSEGHR